MSAIPTLSHAIKALPNKSDKQRLRDIVSALRATGMDKDIALGYAGMFEDVCDKWYKRKLREQNK